MRMISAFPSNQSRGDAFTKIIEPAPCGAGSKFLEDQIAVLLHGKDQVVVIVVGACGTRGRPSLIAELRTHRLQAAGGKRERGGQALGSGLRGHDRLDKYP